MTVLGGLPSPATLFFLPRARNPFPAPCHDRTGAQSLAGGPDGGGPFVRAQQAQPTAPQGPRPNGVDRDPLPTTHYPSGGENTHPSTMERSCSR